MSNSKLGSNPTVLTEINNISASGSGLESPKLDAAGSTPAGYAMVGNKMPATTHLLCWCKSNPVDANEEFLKGARSDQGTVSWVAQQGHGKDRAI